MKFFAKEPRAGMPISTTGFAKGLASMARALGEMHGVGCHIEWSSLGIPTIVVDDSEKDGSEQTNEIPDGYEERAVKLYCGTEILDCTILVKSNTTEETTNLVSTDYPEASERKMLQVKAVTGEGGTTYQLLLDFGYLAE